MIKNTAGQRIGAQMVSATDGSAFTGAVTVAVTVDAGTQATGSVGSGACTHEGNGYHTYAPSQAETNGDLLAFTFTGSGAIPATLQIYTVAGDAFTRLGAPAGASIAADIAGIQADTNDIQTRLPAALVSGRIDASVGAMATDVLTSTALAASAVTEIQTGLSTLDAAGVRTAVGLASANLDTQLSGIQADTNDIQTRLPAALVGGRMDANVGAISADSVAADNAEAFFDGTGYAGTGNTIPTVTTLTNDPSGVTTLLSRVGTPSNLGSGASVAANLVDIESQTDDIGAAGAGLTAIPWNAAWDAEVESEVADALEATIADSIPADGTRPSVKQALYMLTQFMLERSVSSTTVTVRKPDGSTALFTLTLNDATTPTSITRAS